MFVQGRAQIGLAHSALQAVEDAQLDVPENAPDGRSVPVFVETSLPMVSTDYVKAIHIVVDHNPDIYLAGFTFKF